MNHSPKDKKTKLSKKSILFGSLIALSIAISPYIFYLYNSFPDDQTTWEVLFFSFNTESYPSLFVKAWYFVQKFVPLMLIVIWFFTCKHWWYHVILIPLSMYSFQLFSVLNEDAKFVDEIEYIYIIPIMMIVIPFVYLIRLKLFDKVVHGIDLKKLDEELERLDHLEDYHDESLEID